MGFGARGSWRLVSKLSSSRVGELTDRVTDIARAFEDDDAPTKLNLSVTGFREDSGRIFVPPSVRYAEKQMKAESVLADQVLPAWGDEKFLDAGVKFAYGAETNGRYQPEYVSPHWEGA